MTSEVRSRPRSPSGRSADEVSDLDKRIIEHLQADGRRPYTQIAADLGVSESAVRARTNRLIERGAARLADYGSGSGPTYGLDLQAVVNCARDRMRTDP